MSSRRLAGFFALLSWAAPLILPLAAVAYAGGHGCTEEACRCAHRAPSAPAPEAEKPCHGEGAATSDCRMSAACGHERTVSLATSPLYELPAVTNAPAPPRDPQALAAGIPAFVRHGFARVEPHPPPAA